VKWTAWNGGGRAVRALGDQVLCGKLSLGRGQENRDYRFRLNKRRIDKRRRKGGRQKTNGRWGSEAQNIGGKRAVGERIP